MPGRVLRGVCNVLVTLGSVFFPAHWSFVVGEALSGPAPGHPEKLVRQSPTDDERALFAQLG
ncbi:DUF6059 family protein [Actinokineospora sp. NBRC 105648]|uniref:DUF6059 family protein n=1 Tax=Actinokineospora sp. NBRC 105648 TaxID=3032206 RepID=UPI00255609DA|nr:DUF6059 family protein [Actinokineospora sp. NBRC 105648]